MQKASYYDSSTLFGGYSYANGFGYEGAQPPFPASSHLESDFQRSSCSLQSHGKNKELNGSCMRPASPNANCKKRPESGEGIAKRGLRVAKGWRNRFREGLNSRFPAQNCKKRPENRKGLEETYEPHVLQANGAAYGAMQGSPAYVGGNFVDSLPASGPALYGLNHLGQQHQAGAMDYGGVPPGQPHGPCESHAAYAELSSHHATSQGRIQEAPKLTHL
ncbi:homeobox protein Hox-B3a-like [Geospiza fortis]|uniref:Homeobox protein Hox-B3a-like n=1 Tax=Geospiza fortis TaxID=48883 RepID=A0A6I9ZAR5_GEOFO|nr:homeobox protein Hox-B3a-like [Geospiza fortis]